jgi:peptide/nickel transport system permease protein
MLTFVLLVTLLGPTFAPHGLASPIGSPGQAPSSAAPLGTDFLGRDVLSRVLYGGRSVVALAGISTVLTYLVGVSVGGLAGYSQNWLDPLLMRAVDLLLTFPALLLLLVLISGAGSGTGVLVLGTVLVLSPGVARIVRASTLEVSSKSYIEAAVARGERTPAILVREIFPNIVHVLLADLGVRFAAAVILIASVNFLGLGLSPPSSNWGLMITENQPILISNPWAVLAPAIMLAALTISVSLIGDTYARSLGRSRGQG